MQKVRIFYGNMVFLSTLLLRSLFERHYHILPKSTRQHPTLQSVPYAQYAFNLLDFFKNIYNKYLIVQTFSLGLLLWCKHNQFEACNMAMGNEIDLSQAIGQISIRRVYYSSAVNYNLVFYCKFHALLVMGTTIFWHTWYSCMKVHNF